MGKRSNGPIRAAMYGEASNYQTIANNEVLVIPMIETQQGIDNIDEILERARHQRHLYRPVRHGARARHGPEPGPRGADDPRDLREAVSRPARSTASSPASHNGTAAYAARMIGMGFRFVTIANDSGLMARAAREAVTANAERPPGEVAQLDRAERRPGRDGPRPCRSPPP